MDLFIKFQDKTKPISFDGEPTKELLIEKISEEFELEKDSFNIDPEVNIESLCFGDEIGIFCNLSRFYTNQLKDNNITTHFKLFNALDTKLYNAAKYKMEEHSYLWLYDNQITDISALSELTGLEGLSLYNNKISDISALSGLVGLKTLLLYNNQISDISALGELTNLEGLSLYNNQISDISALSGLVGLERLWLAGNPISKEQIIEFKIKNPKCMVQF